MRAARDGTAPADIPDGETVSQRSRLSLPTPPIPLTPILGRQTELDKLHLALQVRSTAADGREKMDFAVAG